MKAKVVSAFFCIVCVGTLSACAELKDTGRAIGHGTRDVTTTIGHATRDTVKTIGHSTKKAVADINDSIEDKDKSK